MADTMPILFDTDPGSDIDDVIALAYLLRQPRCQLLGVTTVTGPTELRAGIVDYVLRQAGRERDIPVHAGVRGPLHIGKGQPEVPHYPAIAALPHRRDFPRSAAIDFLRTVIRANPGRITLLTVGPLTNIAVLFALDPELPAMLHRVVTMGGRFFPPAGPEAGSEWNILCDPVAAQIVYSTPVPGGHTSYGFDVTSQCQLRPDEVRARFAGKPVLPSLLDMADVWFKHSDRVTFHDPLAAVGIFHPELCQYRTGGVRLEPSADPQLASRTHFTASPDGTGLHTVAESVDSQAFFRRYFEVFA